ncbi:aminoglycoside phosphotransferase family protein [Actinotalea sp. Marseille-Q4924]|uniref:aminoglycoside phosphotransferase family protein n=1 Tax=Actinotalea sp. Marseille-Q4924 TaxID=2866571 RepID=UPI001CE45329|nr:aminoglycoside phosphotransferase family protein [Actinotalea sp. Marseille-Q4924]
MSLDLPLPLPGPAAPVALTPPAPPTTPPRAAAAPVTPPDEALGAVVAPSAEALEHRLLGDRVEVLPLPTAGWHLADALDALAEARLAMPYLPATDAVVVVSDLTTVVLRLGDHAVKVYPPGTDPAHLGRIVTGLAGSTTALLPTGGPVVTSSGVVLVSPWRAPVRPVDWTETGALLRRFHDDHADADVAAWDPLRRLVTQVDGLADDDARVLLDARRALLDAVADLRPFLAPGVLHGDVSPLNVLRTADGPVLIDIDFVARGPREYDLFSAARRHVTGELDDVAYLGFCRAYGADVRGWDGFAVLDRIGRLGGVAFRLWDDRRHGRPLDWLPTTVSEWRTPL